MVVVGVAPAGFSFPGRDRVDVYIPHSFPPVVSDDGRRVFMVLVHVIGRLAPGQSVESAGAELEVVRRQSAAAFYPAPGLSRAATLMTRDALRVRPLHDQLVGDVRGRVWLLSGAIALLLLIACANVANLQVIRTLGRQRELAVRLTMGATRRRVAAQLLTETLVLGGLAAAVALAALGLGMGGMRALIADTALFADTIGLDGATLGFAVAVVVLMCLVSVGAALAWLPRFLHRAAAGLHSGAAVTRRRLQGALLGGQVALTLVLLVSAGLLLTSLTRLTATDTGFDPRYLLTFRAVSHLGEIPRQAAFIDGVLERVGALPGVESVAMTDRLPFETTPTSEIGTEPPFHRARRFRRGAAEGPRRHRQPRLLSPRWACASKRGAILATLASVTVDAQDDTVVRVDYVVVIVQADGTESPQFEGVRYIFPDGRHRHDQTPAGGEKPLSVG